MGSIFGNKAFVCMLAGTTVSEIGGSLGTFCNSIIIYEMTGSKMALSSMWLLYFIPSLLLQLGIGPFIDKWSRKWIMVVSQWIRGSVFMALLLLMVTGGIKPWEVYAVQVVIGLIQPLYVPASIAITPTILAKDLLNAANSYIDGAARLMSFLAPMLGGIIVQYIGVQLTLSLVCASFVVSGCLLMFLVEPRTHHNVRATWLQQLKEGFMYFLQQPSLLWLGIFLAFVQFGVGVTMVLNLPYITHELQGTYTDYGLYMAAFPLGYVMGSIFAGKFKLTSDNIRLTMLGALVIGGLTYIALGFNTSVKLAIVTELIAGIAMPFFNVNSTTIYQHIVPNELIGKVFSVRLFMIRSAMPLGVLAGGFLSELWGVRTMYIVIGVLICISSLLGIVLPYFKFLNETYNDNVSG